MIKQDNGIRSDWDPHAILKRDLEATNIVGSEKSENLRVIVLSKANFGVVGGLVVVLVQTVPVVKYKGRIVIEPQN